MDFNGLRKYVGSTSQLFGIREYTMNGGRSEGVRAADVKDGTGLEFTVSASRCMDISQLSYKGINFSFISPNGPVAPQYYEPHGVEFLRSFTAGFFTTCGLTNTGSPCVDEGEELGLHGRISHIPAGEFGCRTETEGGVPVMRLHGKMRQCRLFGENLVLTRDIVCRYGERRIEVTDEIENESYRRSPLMLLYHCNMGYPLLDENAQIVLPSKKVTPRNEHAAEGLNGWMHVQAPEPGYEEMCFYHDLAADDEGRTMASLYNPALKCGVVLRFEKQVLDHFTEWKMMAPGEYVLGLEPSNCALGGRAEERAKGGLKMIEPGEKRVFRLTAEIIDGDEEFRRIKGEAAELCAR